MKSVANTNRRAFTLIELLVVISIIALLISLLLPALRSARETARTVQCGSQIRQVMMGLLMYADDYDGSLPFSFEESNFEGGRVYWPGLIGSSRFGYLPSPQTFWCGVRDTGWWEPEVQNMLNDPYESHWAYTGYTASRYGAMPTYNDATDPSRLYYPVNIAKGALPASKLLVLMEGYRPDYYAMGRDGFYAIFNGSSAAGLISHGGKITNSAFLDGHAESMQDEALGWSADQKRWHTQLGLPYDREDSPWYHFRFVKR